MKPLHTWGVVSAITVLAYACEARVPDAQLDAELQNSTTLIPGETFGLQRIGDEEVESRQTAQYSCRERPFWGRIELRGERWALAESLFVACPSPAGPGTLHFRVDSGYWRARPDTLGFYSDSRLVGLEGWLFDAARQLDTLTLFGTEEEGGRFQYVRLRD